MILLYGDHVSFALYIGFHSRYIKCAKLFFNYMQSAGCPIRRGGEFPAKFSTHPSVLHLSPQGSIKPSGHSFWSQVVFRGKVTMEGLEEINNAFSNGIIIIPDALRNGQSYELQIFLHIFIASIGRKAR